MGTPTDAEVALRRQTWLAAIGVAAGVALAGGAIWMQRPRGEPIEIGQQTTYLTSPTRADGWVDYPEAVDWMRRASLDAGGTNAVQPLLRALGSSLLPRGADRAAVLKQLGISDAGLDASTLRPVRDFPEIKAAGEGGPQLSPEAVDWLHARCVPSADLPISLARARGWIAQSEGALANLVAASRAAVLYVPVTRAGRATTERDYGRVGPARMGDALDALRCRAAVELLQGDAEASWNDVDALWKLGLLVAHSAPAVEYALGAAFWKAALGGTLDLVAAPAVSEELLSSMLAASKARPSFPPATESLMLVRLLELDAVGTPRVARPGSGTPPGTPVALPGTGALLESVNRSYDAFEAVLQIGDPQERRARFEKLAAAAGERAGPKVPVGGQWAEPPSVAELSRGLLTAEVEAVSYQRLASVALAVAQRRRETGKLPASLAELGDLPKDPGSGGGFGYAPGPRQFRLHATGIDGRDDGGDPAKDLVGVSAAPPRHPAP